MRSRSRNPAPLNQVCLVQGRASVGESPLHQPGHFSWNRPDNSQTVRLRADTGKPISEEIRGRHDLNRDGVEDIISNHDKVGYFFDSALINDALGGEHFVGGLGNPASGDSVVTGPGGSYIAQKVANIRVAGNFDQDPSNTPDLVYGIASFFNWGTVSFRSNQVLDSIGPQTGVMPFEDIVMTDVVEMSPSTAFGVRIASLETSMETGKRI